MFEKSLGSASVIVLLVTIGYSTSQAQQSCSALIDTIKSKTAIIQKSEKAVEAATFDTRLQTSLKDACALAKAAVAASDEVKRLSAEYERRCKVADYFSTDLSDAQGLDYEAIASRVLSKDKRCR